jgi:hypothetical protein
MSRNEPRAGPLAEEPARHVPLATTPLGPRSRVKVAQSVARSRVDELAARRELRAWAEAAAWLNEHGFAAAVPARFVTQLARRGLVIWATGERRAA